MLQTTNMRPISLYLLLKTSNSSILLSKKYFSSFETNVSLGQNYERILQHCVLNKNLNVGKLIHSKIVTKGLEEDSFFATKLINLYSTFGDIHIAELVLGRVSNHNVFILNAMIRGYSTNGLYQQALNFFYQKRVEGIKPDSYTISCLLKACGLLLDIQQGNKIQNLAAELGLGSDLFVSNALISMFGKCGSIFDAVKVFEKMSVRDIVSWNSLITAYIENGFHWEVMVKVEEIVQSGLRLDQVTIVSVLSVCSDVISVQEMHGYIIKNGHEFTASVCNSLLSMYGKCGRTEDAASIFNTLASPDRVAWNALISTYAQNGCFEKSVRLLQKMRDVGLDSDVVTYSGIISSLAQNERAHDAMTVFIEMLDMGLKPDVITLASIIPAVADLLCLDYCQEMHAYSYRHGLEPDRRIKNALLSVYAKCGSIQNAVWVFADTSDRDVITWSSMVIGYVQNGYLNEAHATFRDMIKNHIQPNPITVTSILSAYAGMSCIQQGKEVHLWAFKNSFEGQTFVGSALIDMYAKCGRLDYSRRVFDLITEKNLVTWNSMILGYAVHGLTEKALEIFQRVEKPDNVSFLAALSACNHGGMVEEGIRIFNSMERFGVSCRERHYGCLVDMLGRSGRVDEAFDLIKDMPLEANADIWGALLGACKIHLDLEVGIYTGSQVIDFSSVNSGHYVLLSNILADSKRWEEAEAMRKKMSEMGVKKGAGCSWIELNKVVHPFIAKERAQHPEWDHLSRILRSLVEQMKEMK